MRSLSPTLTFLLATFTLLALGVYAPDSSAEDHPGQAVFEAEKCGLCHSVSAAGIEASIKSEKMKGPDLAGFQAEDAEWTVKFLRKEAKTPEGESHRRAAKASDEELASLLEWLASLEPAAAGQ